MANKVARQMSHLPLAAWYSENVSGINRSDAETQRKQSLRLYFFGGLGTMGRKTNDERSGDDAALYSARDRVIAAMPGIVDAIIEKAEDGSYLHAKFLLEFAQSGPGGESNAEDGESLASFLMKELREEPAA